MLQSEGNIKLYAVVVDCKEPKDLAAFYAALLQWDIVYQDEEYACIGAKGVKQGAYPGITFQRNDDYEPPVWPERCGKQQQMEHLDFIVNDLDEAVQHALTCGAKLATEQFSDGWRVMLDPSGHPFCLCLMKEVFASADFALR